MLLFNRKYFFIAVVLFIILVFIAIFVKDRFVRPYFGDYLVVIFLYFSARSFLRTSQYKIAVAALLFSYLIEVLQYFKIIQALGLQDVEIAKVIIGHGFEWLDFVAYTLGILTVLTIEFISSDRSKDSYE